MIKVMVNLSVGMTSHSVEVHKAEVQLMLAALVELVQTIRLPITQMMTIQ